MKIILKTSEPSFNTCNPSFKTSDPSFNTCNPSFKTSDPSFKRSPPETHHPCSMLLLPRIYHSTHWTCGKLIKAHSDNVNNNGVHRPFMFWTNDSWRNLLLSGHVRGLTNHLVKHLVQLIRQYLLGYYSLSGTTSVKYFKIMSNFRYSKCIDI